MFSTVPMLQVRLLVLERDQRAVLEQLGSLGAVQLMTGRPGPDTAPLPARDPSVELARCDDFLARIEAMRRDLGAGAATAAPALSWKSAEETLHSLETRANDLQQRRESLSHRQDDLEALRERVSPFCGFGLPLDEPGRFEFLHFVTGALPPGKIAQIQADMGEKVAILPLGEGKEWQPLIALTTRGARQELAVALEREGFQPEPLPEVQGATADTLFSESRRELDVVSAELRAVQGERQQLAAEAAAPVAAIEKMATRERRLLEAAQTCPRTETAVLLTGWIPAPEAPAVERRLRETTAGRCVCECAAPGDGAGEPVPVLLHHPGLLRPFERLVSAYGLPRYGELEPTLFVAVSFVLMFGMMFGDAGHGFLLALAGWLALARGREGKTRDLGVLLLFGGVSSFVFGVVYGSYFGLPHLKRHALWQDPLEADAMALMGAAIGMGVLLISLGLVLNMINRFRSGDMLGGFLDRFGVAGAVFYWGMLALLTRFAAFQSQGLTGAMLLLCLVFPIAAWTLKEPLEQELRRRRAHEPVERRGGLFAAGVESLVGAFEAVLSYLANTLSFVRLAAYAMSHAALLTATFVMAAEVQRATVAGSVLVIVLGNLAAMVLEGVIACVQALRLEYYEFFSKFFSAAGRAFRPFRFVEG